MFKFLLYLFLIYFVVRFLFRSVAGPVINVKTFHYHTQAPHPQKDEDDDDATVIIEKPRDAKKGGNDKALGEYVDYEEIK